MKKSAFVLLGLLLFFTIWVGIWLCVKETEGQGLLVFLTVSFSLPIVYSLLYQKRYPTETVLVLSVVEFFLYKFTVFQTDPYPLGVFFYQVNFFLGSIVVLLGGFVDKAATKLLSPIQTYLSSNRLRLSIPVISGIVFFIVGYFLISTEIYRLVL